ncbi:hypothetical protein ACU70A_11450 [Syntrophomonas erecta subsp. sporosyntropha]
MKLSRREVILLVALLLCGLVYAFVNYYFRPVQAQISALQRENQKLESSVDVLKTQVDTGQSLEKEKGKMEEEYRRLAAKVPEEAYIPEVIAFMESGAADARVVLLSIDYRGGEKEKAAADQLRLDVSTKTPAQIKPEDSPSFSAVEFQLTARGSYPALVAFMMKIENAKRLLNIKNSKISLTKCQVVVNDLLAEAEDQSPQTVEVEELQLHLTVTAYYDPDSKAGINGVNQRVPAETGRPNPFEY